MRLMTGDAEGALEDGRAAAEVAPPDFSTAYVRQVGRLMGAGL